MTEDVSQAAIDALKAEIADLTAKLEVLHARRREMFIAMDATMSRRAIGTAWGISGVMVTHVINKGKFKNPFKDMQE